MSQDIPSTELRLKIERIDDQLHDLLVQRATLSEGLSASERHGGVIASLRRLVSHHHGKLPIGAVARIWRELIGATPYPDRAMSVAVFATEGLPDLWDIARDHFGSQAPLLPYRSAVQVVQAVSEGKVTVGVLPLPAENDEEPWWRQIIAHDRVAPHVVARLPFAGRGNARGSREGLAISLDPESPLADRTLIAIEFSPETSRTRLSASLIAAGLEASILAYDAHDNLPMALADLAGAIDADDPRLAQLAEELGYKADGVSRLGSYAAPLPRLADNHNAPIRVAS